MRTILIQLDTDTRPCSFDRVVAVDAGVDEMFCYGGVDPESVPGLVRGGMFTRGIDDLKNTAVFVGGSSVSAGEAVFEEVQKTYFGPVRMSVMMDSNGSNTTAAAAVLSARKHLDLSQCEALVLGGTGPVGMRVVQLLAMEGASVRIGSRSQERADEVSQTVEKTLGNAKVSGRGLRSDDDLNKALDGCQLLICAGAAGVQLVSQSQIESAAALQVAIDLNAVPPLGIEGIDVTDKAKSVSKPNGSGDVLLYGAIGVGGLKMKIHKAAIRKLFTANNHVLDTEAIYRVGEGLVAGA
ncbi:NAD(P)-dependent methylenetetrahydromethanopterin dehydrogenase [Thalassoroseus pseudoceratinae]|uniref:NAD(P)-dependent methylenetetrahydromethanopterin dehydrogenase n=1 Tax=Thalassoroseus pseudoceratinae TaxID=2713176 RepID=UPI00141FA344|nr:NAD(P)-dependent methylenetetrahydromethanopterin dehydrogenase [Thalassoroseus pseudoceratinae]